MYVTLQSSPNIQGKATLMVHTGTVSVTNDKHKTHTHTVQRKTWQLKVRWIASPVKTTTTSWVDDYLLWKARGLQKSTLPAWRWTNSTKMSPTFLTDTSDSMHNSIVIVFYYVDF